MVNDTAFYDDLSEFTFIELIVWLTERYDSVLLAGNNGIDGDKLESLYDNFVEVFSMKKRVRTSYSEEEERLFTNAAVFKSQIFKSALITLRGPGQRFFLDTGDSLVEITKEYFKHEAVICCQARVERKDIGDTAEVERKINTQTSISNEMELIAQKYMETIKKILDSNDLGFRQKIKYFILRQDVRQSYFVYRIPAKRALTTEDIDKVIKNLNQYMGERHSIFEKEMVDKDSRRKENCYNSKKIKEEVRQYGIAQATLDRYYRGNNIEKIFLVRLAFYLGLENTLSENLFQREGFSMEKSCHPTDIIYYNSLRIGFPLEYAVALCDRKNESTIKKEKSLEA